MTIVRERGNGNNAIIQVARTDSGSQEGDSPRATLEDGNLLGGCMPKEGLTSGFAVRDERAQLFQE